MNKREKTRSSDLSHADRVPPLQDRDLFWAEFRERAQAIPQDGRPALPPMPFLLRPAVRLAAMLAALAVVSSTVAFWIGRNGPDNRVSNVQEVKVFVEYSSMVIVEDTVNGGTFVWINEESGKDQG